MNLTFETPRLLLRPLVLSDAKDLFVMDSNPNVHKNLWQKPYASIQEIHDYIEMIRNQYLTHNIGRFSTILKETIELIGWTGIKYIENHIENGNTNFYDYGYRLDEKFWNKGYATEASIAWLDYGFNQMNIKIMNAYTHTQNGASNHVLQKVGFNFVEDYLDKDGTMWKWWKMEKDSL